jgi:hypothetical protein
MIIETSLPGMNNEAVDSLIRTYGSHVDGVYGAWRFQLDSVLMYCITDEKHNRLRIIAPIANVDELSDKVLRECLSANFDRTLDARYCIHDETVWGAFIHPFDSLSEEQFQSALLQVSSVAKNFGSSYSSGQLVFGGK